MKEMIFACPSCDQHIQCDASHAGENIPCPSCAVLIRVPTSHAIAEVEVPTPVTAPAPAADNKEEEDPFNNATHKTDAVSYTSLKSGADGAEKADEVKPAKPVETAKDESKPAPNPNAAQPPAEKIPRPLQDIYCICPSCQAELRLPAESLEQPAGTLVSTEIVRPSPAKATRTPAVAKSEAEPSDSADVIERERKIAEAREHIKIQANATVKPRLSYILTGGEAPAASENNSVHDPVPETGDTGQHRSLSE
jgi:hypothetical protein